MNICESTHCIFDRSLRTDDLADLLELILSGFAGCLIPAEAMESPHALESRKRLADEHSRSSAELAGSRIAATRRSLQFHAMLLCLCCNGID